MSIIFTWDTRNISFAYVYCIKLPWYVYLAKICESDMVSAFHSHSNRHCLVLTSTSHLPLTVVWLNTFQRKCETRTNVFYTILFCLFSWTLYIFNHSHYLQAKIIISKNILCSWVEDSWDVFPLFPFFCSTGHILCWMFWQ